MKIKDRKKKISVPVQFTSKPDVASFQRHIDHIESWFGMPKLNGCRLLVCSIRCQKLVQTACKKLNTRVIGDGPRISEPLSKTRVTSELKSSSPTTIPRQQKVIDPRHSKMEFEP
ncbi:hypothetical protein TNCV_1253521 [Trichonephila clavipes]|nr:hypothetical protein TNCV_1253521 [Trichonephila clavipes]